MVPSEDPAGNLPSDVVWVGDAGHEHKTDELLALVQEMRLGRAADLYGRTAATAPVQPAQGTDLGNDGDEAHEDSGGDDEQGPGSTPGRDPAWC